MTEKEKDTEKEKGRVLKVATLVEAIALIGVTIAFFSYRSQLSQYKEQIAPEISCYYRYFTADESYKFIIHNSGLIDCKDIWAQEKIFVIINGEVYHGDDVPHYNYFVYNGSRKRMWDLDKGDKLEVSLADLQIKAFWRVREKFHSEVISRWRIDYSKENSSKRYHYESYFIFDFSDRNFKEPEDYVGAIAYKNKIKDYLSSGSKKTIGIFDLAGDFEIDPPPAFIINPDYSFIPLYPWTKVSIADLKNCLFVEPGFRIQPADDVSEGILRYVWKLENGRWSKVVNLGGQAEVYSQPIAMAKTYLSNKEAKMVMANPSLLKSRPIKDPEEMILILEKARDKYLADRD